MASTKEEAKMRTILATIALTAATVSAAFAHSPIKYTSPGDGATIANAPSVIEIIFDGEMRLTRVTLDGPGDGAQRLELSGIEMPTPEYRLPAPALVAGRYSVEWRGMAPDGHVMTGSFVFEIE
ncbi:MAG: copper resistance protein CopC [Pseudomonadota bacterium]